MRLLILLLLAGAAAGATLRYWVEPCAAARDSSCHEGDPQLAAWALEAWQAASGGELHLEAAPKMANAQIRVFWANGRGGLYGEARPIVVEGIRGAEVYVLPEQSNSADIVLRDAILYLTCLHETDTRSVCNIPPSSPTSCTAFNSAAISRSTSAAIAAC